MDLSARLITTNACRQPVSRLSSCQTNLSIVVRQAGMFVSGFTCLLACYTRCLVVAHWRRGSKRELEMRSSSSISSNNREDPGAAEWPAVPACCLVILATAHVNRRHGLKSSHPYSNDSTVTWQHYSNLISVWHADQIAWLCWVDDAPDQRQVAAQVSVSIQHRQVYGGSGTVHCRRRTEKPAFNRHYHTRPSSTACPPRCVLIMHANVS